MDDPDDARDLTREVFLRKSALGALAASGVYGLVDTLAPPPARALATGPRHPAEQHVLRGVRIVRENGVEVVVPPRHHQIVTAMLRVGPNTRELRAARAELEHALAGLDRRFASTPAGLATTVGWGRSYFRDFLPRLRDGKRFPHYLPVDVQASKRAGKRREAILDAVRFPSDPASLRLEENHLCVLFRSDSLEHIATGARAVFDSVRGVVAITSIRKGFVGGGEAGGRSLPKLSATGPSAEHRRDELMVPRWHDDLDAVLGHDPHAAEHVLFVRMTRRRCQRPRRLGNQRVDEPVHAGGGERAQRTLPQKHLARQLPRAVWIAHRARLTSC